MLSIEKTIGCQQHSVESDISVFYLLPLRREGRKIDISRKERESVQRMSVGQDYNLRLSIIFAKVIIGLKAFFVRKKCGLQSHFSPKSWVILIV